MENPDFPELKGTSLDTYFQEELVALYFYSVRSCPENLLLLEKRFGEVLQVLEPFVSKYEHFTQLFYNLVLHIRKTGEHDLTYMMIWQWYNYFPNLAKQLMKKCLSWRDMVYFCNYVSLHMKDRKVIGETLIEYCVRSINEQLVSDMEVWKFSMHAGSRDHISNVAKWIPRENKRFSWLYELLVLDWIKLVCPYLLQTTTRSYSYDAAILKGKRLYRKKITTLNKALQTVQIKQCSKQVEEIMPYMVSKYTAMKQPKLRDISSKNTYYSLGYSGSRELTLPIAYYVKEALNHSESIHEQWTTFVKKNSFSYRKDIIPILDISNKIQFESNESYYTGIGLALLIAELTSTMRILAIGENPIWIKIEPNMSFVERVLFIHEKCRHYQCSRIDSLIQLIHNYSMETGEDFVEKNKAPTFVILSDFSVSIFHGFHEKVSAYCTMFYWNLSSKHSIENLVQMNLPCSIHQKNIGLLAGFSFSPMVFETIDSPYVMLEKLLL